MNRSQQLFSSCTAKFADGQQCSVPVFDITHQTPLCEEHAKKMVSTFDSQERGEKNLPYTFRATEVVANQKFSTFTVLFRKLLKWFAHYD